MVDERGCPQATSSAGHEVRVPDAGADRAVFDADSACRVLDALAESMTRMTHLPVHQILRSAPAQVLTTVPDASHVELTVLRFGDPHVVVHRASRGQGRAPSVPPVARTLALRIKAPECGITGCLTIGTEVTEGLLGVSALTCEIMAGQVEHALELAHARTVRVDLEQALVRTREIASAIALALVGDGVSEQVVRDLLCDLREGDYEQLVRPTEGLRSTRARTPESPRLWLVPDGPSAPD